MKKILIITFIPLLLISSNCNDDFKGKYDYRLKIRNDSKQNIYFDIGFDYPDTSLNFGNPINNKNTLYVTMNNEQTIRSSTRWEYLFSDYLPSDTLMLFVFDAKAIESTAWDTIQKKYLILKRYDLSLYDLEDLNWTITYP